MVNSMLGRNHKDHIPTSKFGLDSAASYYSRSTASAQLSLVQNVCLLNCDEPAAIANTIPKLHQKMKVMKRKKVELEAMVGQNVWNVNCLRDQKRLAPGKGSTVIFLWISSLLSLYLWHRL